MFDHDIHCWVAPLHTVGQLGYRPEQPVTAGGPPGSIACGWSPPEPMKRGHRIINTVGPMPAVYRVELGPPGALSAWYVGETKGFKGRMRAYGVMIRRLLAMYSGVGPVVIDKDLFRLVQYEFARSIVVGEHIQWRWRYLPEGANTKAVEEREIAAAKERFPGVRTLNRKHGGTSYGYFDTMPVKDVDPAWRAVHARVAPHAGRKKAGIQRVVV